MLNQICSGAIHRFELHQRAIFRKLRTQWKRIWVERGSDFPDTSKQGLGEREQIR
jgi:hypothetical protein